MLNPKYSIVHGLLKVIVVIVLVMTYNSIPYQLPMVVTKLTIDCLLPDRFSYVLPLQKSRNMKNEC